MSRKLNFISNVLSFVITLGALLFVTLFSNTRYSGQLDPFLIIAMFIGFAIVCGFICTLLHELGHLLVGLKNNFVFLSFNVWFFKWWKPDGKIRFDFVMMKEEAGSTEFVPKGTNNIEKRLNSMTIGGLVFSFFAMLISLPAFLIPSMPLWLYCFLSMFLPIGAFVFFGNALPMVNEGARNDGAVVLGVKKKHDSVKVLINILKIHAELYQGKTPGEIDQALYFDLPQIAEDDINFICLLNLRYHYYLDKQDYENAKKTTSRLKTLTDYMPGSIYNVIKADELYNACTFDRNDQTADELVEELDKYLNKTNSATNLRIKLAYILLEESQKEIAKDFYDRAKFEADRVQIKGLGAYESKLLDNLIERN